MDNKNETALHDASRVNVNEAYELRYWSRRFNVSEEDLKKAVSEVGTSAVAVEQFFNNKR